jgi:Ribosomal protein S9/S16
MKGRALATGRRKASSARVWVSHGVGDVTINGVPMSRYFRQAAHRGSALAPLMALATPQAYNVRALVEGGGALQPRAMLNFACGSHFQHVQRSCQFFGLLIYQSGLHSTADFTRSPRCVPLP